MKYYLYHHGILGQRWGKRNGPPYPLGASDHSASEKKAGWKKSLDKGSEKSYNSDKENSEKIGKAVFNTYKSRKPEQLNRFTKLGKNRAKEILSGDADDIFKRDEKAEVVDTANEVKNVIDSGFSRLVNSETLEETMRNTNPLRGKPEGRNNCTVCGISACLRMMGYDVKAKGTGREMQNLLGIVEECFDNFKKIEGSAVKFGRSRNDAAEMLLKRFGKNAYGVVNIQWKGSGGHTFNWKIENSIVSFFDAQNNWDDSIVSSRFWGLIDPQGAFQAARLDTATIKDADALKKYVE